MATGNWSVRLSQTAAVPSFADKTVVQSQHQRSLHLCVLSASAAVCFWGATAATFWDADICDVCLRSPEPFLSCDPSPPIRTNLSPPPLKLPHAQMQLHLLVFIGLFLFNFKASTPLYANAQSIPEAGIDISELLNRAANEKLSELRQRPTSSSATTKTTTTEGGMPVPRAIDIKRIPFTFPAEAVDIRNARRCQFTNGTLWESATECDDELGADACQSIFAVSKRNGGTDTGASSTPRRPLLCLNPELTDLARRCAHTCALCCETPRFNCADSGAQLIDCAAHKAKCTQPAWRRVMMSACEHTCGLCSADACFDSAPDCESLRSLCFHRAISPILRQQCARTCQVCRPESGADTSEEVLDVRKTPKEVIVLVRKHGRTTPAPKGLRPLCRDVSPSCVDNKALCTDKNYADFLRDKCALTCGHCPAAEASAESAEAEGQSAEQLEAIRRIRNRPMAKQGTAPQQQQQQKRAALPPGLILLAGPQFLGGSGEKEQFELRGGGGETLRISREVVESEGGQSEETTQQRKRHRALEPLVVILGASPRNAAPSLLSGAQTQQKRRTKQQEEQQENETMVPEEVQGVGFRRVLVTPSARNTTQLSKRTRGAQEPLMERAQPLKALKAENGTSAESARGGDEAMINSIVMTQKGPQQNAENEGQNGEAKVPKRARNRLLRSKDSSPEQEDGNEEARRISQRILEIVNNLKRRATMDGMERRRKRSAHEQDFGQRREEKKPPDERNIRLEERERRREDEMETMKRREEEEDLLEEEENDIKRKKDEEEFVTDEERKKTEELLEVKDEEQGGEEAMNTNAEQFLEVKDEEPEEEEDTKAKKEEFLEVKNEESEEEENLQMNATNAEESLKVKDEESDEDDESLVEDLLNTKGDNALDQLTQVAKAIAELRAEEQLDELLTEVDSSVQGDQHTPSIKHSEEEEEENGEDDSKEEDEEEVLSSAAKAPKLIEREPFDGVLRGRSGRPLRVEELRGGVRGALEQVRRRYGVDNSTLDVEMMERLLLTTERDIAQGFEAILAELKSLRKKAQIAGREGGRGVKEDEEERKNKKKAKERGENGWKRKKDEDEEPEEAKEEDEDEEELDEESEEEPRVERRRKRVIRRRKSPLHQRSPPSHEKKKEQTEEKLPSNAELLELIRKKMAQNEGAKSPQVVLPERIVLSTGGPVPSSYRLVPLIGARKEEQVAVPAQVYVTGQGRFLDRDRTEQQPLFILEETQPEGQRKRSGTSKGSQPQKQTEPQRRQVQQPASAASPTQQLQTVEASQPQQIVQQTPAQSQQPMFVAKPPPPPQQVVVLQQPQQQQQMVVPQQQQQQLLQPQQFIVVPQQHIQQPQQAQAVQLQQPTMFVLASGGATSNVAPAQQQQQPVQQLVQSAPVQQQQFVLPPRAAVQHPVGAASSPLLLPARVSRGSFTVLRTASQLAQQQALGAVPRELCRDYHPYCEQVVPHGFCASEFYPLRMKRELCPLSCNLC